MQYCYMQLIKMKFSPTTLNTRLITMRSHPNYYEVVGLVANVFILFGLVVVVVFYVVFYVNIVV